MKTKTKIDNWFLLDAEAVRGIAASVSGVVTQSEIMLRASCARKWFYRYVLQLGKRGVVDQNLIYGSLMHGLLESLYKSPDEAWRVSPPELPIEVTTGLVAQAVEGLVMSPLDLEETELTRTKVQIAFDAYRWQTFQLDRKLWIYSVEETIEVEWKGLKLAGKLDMVARSSRRDGPLIWDFKTAGRLDAMALDAWTFKFQFLFYCWLYWRATHKKPTGLMINGLLKTALRPRQADRKTKRLEDREEYLARVEADMTENREKYFYRQRIPLGADALERFEAEILLPHVWTFRMLQECGKHPKEMIEMVSMMAMQMNTNQCHLYGSYCEFLNLCKDGRVALGEFDRREDKHSELSLDTPEPEAESQPASA